MLSSNSLLRQGRYRVSQLAASNGAQTIYEAHDNLGAKTVLICEKPSSASFASNDGLTHHDGLLDISDRFDENGCSYLVTEPVQGSGPWQLRNRQHTDAETSAVCERLRSILEGVDRARKQFPELDHIDITPLHFRANDRGDLKLGFFETAANVISTSSESPYFALEAVWDTFDLASQKAISNDYDEAELEALDAPLDSRTDGYAIAAVLYQILTGRTPPSALERSIEILDSGKDPLERPEKLNSGISAAFADAMMRMLELKREGRFDSLESAIRSLPTATAPAKSAAPIFELDEIEDLLEIPTSPTKAVATSVETKVSVVEEAPAKTFDRSEEVIEEHPEPFIAEKEFDVVPEPTPEPVAEVVEKAPEPFIPEPEPVAAVTFAPTFGTQSSKPSAYDRAIDDTDTGDSPKGLPVKMIGIAAGAVVVIAVAVFGIMNMSSGSKAATTPEPAASLASQPAPEPSVETISTQQPSETDPEQSATSSYQSTTDKSTSDPAVKTRSQIAETKPVKPTEQKPAANTAPKPKKSMTVDDLINDN